MFAVLFAASSESFFVLLSALLFCWRWDINEELEMKL